MSIWLVWTVLQNILLILSSQHLKTMLILNQKLKSKNVLILLIPESYSVNLDENIENQYIEDLSDDEILSNILS